MKLTIQPIGIFHSCLLFGIPATLLFVVCRVLIPLLHQNYGLHPALSWFIGGLITFVPLFITSIFLVRKDGFFSRNEMYQRFRLRKMSGRDWKFTLIGLLLIFLATGLIMGISKLLHLKFGISEIQTTPSFMKFEPFHGSERLFLLVWLVMFFFNIIGEELMWRGYILPRQEMSLGYKAWIFNAMLWFVFHIAFGIDLLILLVPVLIILPYAVQKTGNTLVGIWIHALMNGPMFVLVSLGIIG